MKKLVCFSTLAFLAGCSFAPDYTAPEISTPVAYKEMGDWIEVNPADEGAPVETVSPPQDEAAKDTKGAQNDPAAWWTIFHDPLLNDLENQVTIANQNLKAALAQYEQASAVADQSRGAFFPSIGTSAGATREKDSTTVANHAPINRYNDFTGGADLSYEIDLWGRVRNVVAANEAEATASADDMQGVALSLHAELANDYFALRGDDASQDILNQTVKADQEAYDLTKRRYEGGVSPESDLDQASVQLENAKTQATDMQLARAQMEHAIAILVGKPPADFLLPPGPMVAQLPATKPGIPSTLLQRRPDVAAAERRVAAANAEIGVARAAWFPTFSVTGAFGFESANTANWLTAPSRFWSLGPQATLPLFEGGAIEALNDQARAAYDFSAATYRETVLEAYRDVEDNLVAMHRLTDENKTQKAATASAVKYLDQANIRYKEGVTTFLDVSVAQNVELQARLAQINILTRRLIAHVQLIRALGSGWSAPEEK